MHDTLMDYALIMGLVCLSTGVALIEYIRYAQRYRNRPKERRNGINYSKRSLRCYWRKVVRK